MSLFPRGFKYWNAIESDTRRLSMTQAGEMPLSDPLYMLTQQWRMGEFRHVEGSIPIRVDMAIVEVPMAAKVDREGATQWLDAGARSEQGLSEPQESTRALAPRRRAVRLALSAELTFDGKLPRSRGMDREWQEVKKRFVATPESEDRLLRLRAKSQPASLDGMALFEAIRNRDAALSKLGMWRFLLHWFEEQGGVLRPEKESTPPLKTPRERVMDLPTRRLKEVKTWTPVMRKVDKSAPVRTLVKTQVTRKLTRVQATPKLTKTQLLRQLQTARLTPKLAKTPPPAVLEKKPFPERWAGAKRPIAKPKPIPDVVVEKESRPSASVPDLFEPETLTHTGSVIFGSPEHNITLSLADSHDGALDWTHFNDEGPLPAAEERSDWVVPTRLSFPGKPEERLWTLADSAADWTAVSAGPSDLSRMLLGALVAEQSADWMIIPVSVARGALVQIKDLQLTTGFGRSMSITAAQPGHLRLWSNLHGQPADNIMTLAEPQPLEGPVLERTVLRPDDHANLLWLIERRLPDDDGRGHDVAEHRAEPPAVDAPVYHLQNDPGENWYPFAHKRGQPFIPRPFATNAGQIKTPQGKTAKAIKALQQGQIAADGFGIERVWQMGRDHEGAPVRWITRRRVSAAETASSGLAYDQLLRPKRQ